MRQIALVTARAGADKPLARFEWSEETQLCSVHGLAHVLGADVWEGWHLSNEFLRVLPGYRVVVVNGNTPLLPVASELARLKTPGQVVCLLQEGDARVWDTLSPDALVNWIAAAKAADVCLLYDPRWASTWKALSGTPVEEVLLPHPADAERHRVPESEREKAIFVASGVVSRRGGFLGVALVRRLLDAAGLSDWKVHCPQGHYGNGCLPDRDFAAYLEKYLSLAVVPWRGYHDYLPVLARCRFAVNLDPTHVYGRFAADCAALAVPCIGSATQVAQRRYWCGIEPSSFGSAGVMLHELIRNETERRRVLGRAHMAAADFSPERVRERFRLAVSGEGDE